MKNKIDFSKFEWDYEYDTTECYYVVLYRDQPIITGLSEEEARKITVIHNLVLSQMETLLNDQ